MTFGIRGNINKTEIAPIVYRLAKGMQSAGIQFIVEKTISTKIGKEFKYRLPYKYTAEDKELPKLSDFIISIGGDGTFLATAKLVGNRNIPIIGVNLGKLGFLAENSTRDILGFIKNVIKGRYFIDERIILETNAVSPSKMKKTLHAINEIVVNQNEIVKTIEISVYFNNQLVNSYHADGIIISTPTGSTGYSLSAGGPIVFPKTDVFILSPLSPHTLTARPVILPDNGVFKVKIKSRVPINVVSDGNDILKLKAPAIIEVKKASYSVKIAKSLESNYFKVLTSKLLWGEDKRKKRRF
ncbi:MAG: NAD(+)/NADH kinase [Ignavibacteria bacterium]|nr:NAD(+)/NADH kinase [Ignavibacteria bacterium]